MNLNTIEIAILKAIGFNTASTQELGEAAFPEFASNGFELDERHQNSLTKTLDRMADYKLIYKEDGDWALTDDGLEQLGSDL